MAQKSTRVSLNAVNSRESVADGVIELPSKRHFDRRVVNQKSADAMTQQLRNEGRGRAEPRGLGADSAKSEPDFANRHFIDVHPELDVSCDDQSTFVDLEVVR